MGYESASFTPSPVRERLVVSFLSDALVNAPLFFSSRNLAISDMMQAPSLTYVGPPSGEQAWLVWVPEGADTLAVMSEIASAPGVKFVEQYRPNTIEPWLQGSVFDPAPPAPLPGPAPAPTSPVLSATSTTLGVLFMLAAVGWALRSL